MAAGAALESASRALTRQVTTRATRASMQVLVYSGKIIECRA